MDIITQNNQNEWVVKVSEKMGKSECELVFVGDMALARRVGDLIETDGVGFPLGQLDLDLLKNDAFIFNLECCLSNRGATWEPKPEFMRGKAEYLGVVKSLHSPKYIANVSNNHFLDYGDVGAKDTLSILGENGIEYIGAVERGEASEPYVLNLKGIRIALLAFSPSAHALEKDAEVNIENSSTGHIRERIRIAKQISDIVIVSLHQGIEYSKYVDKKSRELALASIDAGADCVVSHHPHVLQGVEKYKDGIIFHSIGNFLLDINSERRPLASQTIALKIRISKCGVNDVVIIPFVLNEKFQPEHPGYEEESEIILQLNRLSKGLSNRLRVVMSYQYANSIWLYSNILSFIKMIKKVGLLSTLRYYVGRVIHKSNMNVVLYKWLKK